MKPAQSSHDLDLLDDLIARARKAGADAADALLMNGTSLSVSVRLGELEDLERSEGSDVGLRVLIGQKQGFVASSDTAPEALALLAERAVDMARHAPEDRFCGLAPEDVLAQGGLPDLDLMDDTQADVEDLIARSQAAENAARAIEGITNSEGAGASWSRMRIALMTSHGFAGSYQGSKFSLGVSVLAGEGTAMERDYAHHSVRHLKNLEDAAALGKRAGEWTVRRLNSRSVKPCRVPVVYDPRVGNGLLGSFAQAINGAAVARGTSFLRDRMGEKVFADGIRIVDDPLRARGLRSKPFDGEGVGTRRLDLVDNGVLQDWLLDSGTARQLDLASNGHASRGTTGPPSPGPTNLYMEPGPKTREQLIGEIGDGFYVTELIGMGVNPVTGDYSRGAGGFWIENGEITYPVSGLTVAGNLKDMFTGLEAASDLEFRYGANVPTLRVDGMTVAGS